MSFLDDLPTDEREMIVSLPYRVGLMISQSDAAGGEASDEKELQALSNILGGYAGEVFACESVQYILSETMKRRADWDKWSKGTANVTEDCARAIELLDEKIDEKELNAFKQHLMEVAEAVATAFREVEELSFLENLKMKLTFLKLEYQAKKRGVVYKSFDEFLNISPKERKALEVLARALHINYAI